MFLVFSRPELKRVSGAAVQRQPLKKIRSKFSLNHRIFRRVNISRLMLFCGLSLLSMLLNRYTYRVWHIPSGKQYTSASIPGSVTPKFADKNYISDVFSSEMHAK